MPTLPLSRIQPGQASFGRRASPADLGAAEGAARAERGQAIGQIGGAAAEVVQIHDRIREGANQAKLARAAAQYGADLDRAALDLESDPDLDGREEKIQKASRTLLEQAQKQLPPEMHSMLEDRVFPAAAHARLSVVHTANGTRIENSRADMAEAVRLGADQEAREGDPVRRAQIRGQAVGALDGARASGILDQAQYDELVHRYDRSVSDADLLAALQADPARAYRELASAASPLARGRTEAERLQARGRASDEFRQQLGERRAAASFAQSQTDHAEKDADDAADQRALDLLSGGDLAGLQQHLTETRGVLSRDRRQFYLERIAKGGGIADSAGGGGTNPGAYVALSNRAAAGQLERGEVDDAYRSGLIAKTDRDKLVELTGDQRFGGARKLLRDSLQQSPFKFDTKTQVRNAEAERAFGEFLRDNPKASETDALAYARELIRYTGLKDLSSALPPRFGAPAAGAPFDAAAATAAAMAARASGQLDDAQLDGELQKIEAMEDAQKRAGAAK